LKRYFEVSILTVIVVVLIIVALVAGDNYILIRTSDLKSNFQIYTDVNVYPFYSFIETLKMNPLANFEYVIKNILFGIIIGSVISIFFINDKINKNIKSILFIIISYYSEAIRPFISREYHNARYFSGTFNIDSIIVRYIGCIIATIVIKKIYLYYKNN